MAGKRARLATLLVAGAAAVSGCSAAPSDGLGNGPPETNTMSSASDEALAAYERFWSVADAALASPTSHDWRPQLEAVATGQALESIAVDVTGLASLPAHTEGVASLGFRSSAPSPGTV